MGVHVATSELESPLGTLRLAVTPRGVVRLALPRGGGKGFGSWIAQHLPDAEPIDWLPELDAVAHEIEEYFEGRLAEFKVPLHLCGTPFQLRVWESLRRIPFGETRSYVDVAREIGQPDAVRAVGGANGANPIPILVPCHRVIAADGRLGGYTGGLDVKRRLLAFESARHPRGLL
jgi:O-6-methylguanine DNA methyltransferase